ncbi:hypothetical protein [Lysinibacillus sp. LZ02]|uniref:hypothetical protein n=1 Tax=Lysinibacillus sp. LZ02 TaxID=3420668 RepID=UPI003D364224
MRKGSLIAAALLASTTLAACNTNKDETPMTDNEKASDIVTPYDNNNGTIDGVNNSTNGSDRGLYMNGDNANVESPTSNKDNRGSDFNGGNNMDGAGGNNGMSGNNSTNNRGLEERRIDGVDENATAPYINNTDERIINNQEDIIEDKRDRLDRDNKDE